MTVHPRPKLIIYGDFNCPFSALASARARHLERQGLAEVDWRAVEHAPDIPPGGHPVAGTRRDELQAELDQVRKLLTGGEPDRLTLPTRLANTRLAALAYANAPRTERQEVRERLFDAYWIWGVDLNDPTTLERLGASGGDEPTARRWRDEWLALPRHIVPVMIMPDGYVSRGLGALDRMARLNERP